METVMYTKNIDRKIVKEDREIVYIEFLNRLRECGWIDKNDKSTKDFGMISRESNINGKHYIEWRAVCK